MSWLKSSLDKDNSPAKDENISQKNILLERNQIQEADVVKDRIFTPDEMVTYIFSKPEHVIHNALGGTLFISSRVSEMGVASLDYTNIDRDENGRENIEIGGCTARAPRYIFGVLELVSRQMIMNAMQQEMQRQEGNG